MADTLTVGGLDGAAALVTGGASGIGRAATEILEASGAVVRVADLGGTTSLDVTDRTALDRLARELDEEHGRLDVLVNAAGVLTQNLPADELPADDFRRAYEINVLGTVNACQACFSRLRNARGAIVNVASLPVDGGWTAGEPALP